MSNHKIGDVVTYIAMGGERRTAKIEDFGEKNGRPLFDAVMVDAVMVDDTRTLRRGDLVWGYLADIV